MDKTQLITLWHDMPWNEIKLKANKYLPKFVFIVLIILVAQLVAELTWRFFTPTLESESTSNKNQVIQPKTVISNTGLKEVGAYHLFGDAKKQIVVNEKIIDAPETRLRLDLKGVFASTNTEEALAIISSSKNKDKTYHIGDKVTAGVSLHAIYADRVILKRNGQLETLRLPKPKVGSKAIYSTHSSNTAKSADGKSTKISSSATTQRLLKMRDTLIKDPAKIWQQVRINPVLKKGQVQGYTLVHNDQALMKALNIRKTDIITEINGESLSNPATLYGLMNSLSNQQSLDLTIVRNGQQESIQLTF
jgi:general secretion pathway protein C